MSLNKIYKEYPKAYNSWINSEARTFFNFFDSHKIFITITADYYGSMEYHPTIYEEGEKVYFWINVNWVWEDDIEYKNRTEAEYAAFTKAFEILEGKL